MKKLIMLAILVAALAAVFTTSAFAADVVTPPAPAGQGFGYGAARGLHTPGTGMAQASGQGFAARRGAPEWAGNSETAASILGITSEELQAERLAGKSLATIAASKGISGETLIAKLLDARKATVAQLLADGKITQAQADYMQSNMAEHVRTMVERTNVGPAPFRSNLDGLQGQSPMAGTRGGRWNR
jgi:predicted DNA-binding protein (UPF0251 family)